VGVHSSGGCQMALKIQAALRTIFNGIKITVLFGLALFGLVCTVIVLTAGINHEDPIGGIVAVIIAVEWGVIKPAVEWFIRMAKDVGVAAGLFAFFIAVMRINKIAEIVKGFTAARPTLTNLVSQLEELGTVLEAQKLASNKEAVRHWRVHDRALLEQVVDRSSVEDQEKNRIKGRRNRNRLIDEMVERNILAPAAVEEINRVHKGSTKLSAKRVVRDDEFQAFVNEAADLHRFLQLDPDDMADFSTEWAQLIAEKTASSTE
jgi:hypothetical protein